MKTNLCKYPPALGVAFEQGPSGPSGQAPWVVYREAPRPYREPTQTEECMAWLVGVLEEAGEPLAPKVVYAMGEEAGFKRGAVHMARRELEGVVVHTDNKMSPKNRWALAEGAERIGKCLFNTCCWVWYTWGVEGVAPDAECPAEAPRGVSNQVAEGDRNEA